MTRGSGKVEKVEKETSKGERASAATGGGLGREAGGIVLLALSLFVALSLASLQLGSGTLMGPCGAFVGTCFYALLGVGAYLCALAMGATAVRLLRRRPQRLGRLQLAAFVGGTLFAVVLLHLATGSHRLRGYSTGGLIGEYGAEVMVALLGTAGTVLFGLTGLLLSAVLTTSLTASGLGRALLGAGRAAWRTLSRVALMVFPARGEPADDAVPPPSSLAETRKTLADARRLPQPDRTQAVEAGAIVSEQPIISLPGAADRPRRRRARPDALVAPQQSALDGDVAMQQPVPRDEDATQHDAEAPEAVGPTDATDPVFVLSRRKGETELDAPVAVAAADAEGDRTDLSAVPPPPEAPPAAPAIIDPVRTRVAPPAAVAERAPGKAPLDYIRLGDGEYRLPGLSLLDFDDPGHGELDRQAMLDLAQRLEKTLADYGVKGRVSEIHPGPVVTMYEFVPQAGTKLSKITALSNDLAMALEALKVRIVAPIPGKAAVGIEVPNRVRETVFLKEIIGSESFGKARSKLAMALGKDISGNPIVVDMAKMPHLLVAGTTGSGKSVSVNAMICSLLFNATPDEVKLIMIDPKMLELSIYEGIPHLLLPVVTDPKKANLALRWAVEEMERRYDLISKSGVRDIGSYNKKVEKQGAAMGEAPAEKPAGLLLEAKKIRVWVKDEAGEREVEVEPTEQAVVEAGGVVSAEVMDDISAARAAMHKRQLELDVAMQQEPAKKLPYIVIIIDEFADLMMVASKEVEQSVARIAQKARAAGIHLLLATQRPSVDVITGLIKANFPSRIAFQVASKIDARTILDQQGAESLLGMGDMLFTDRGLALRRVHGPLVTDGEIHKIVDFLKAQGKPVYDLDILKPREEDGEGAPPDEDWSDEMYDQAVAVVSEMRQASTSMLQRRLRLGYNRAARMIERMEREGIVGPADGAKPREVLVQNLASFAREAGHAA